MRLTALRATTVLTAVAALSACAPSNASTENEMSSDGITVVASINQWGTLAEQIGGDVADTSSIITSTSTEAHDYEPTSADIAKIQTADIVIVNGAGYDEWAVKAAESSKASLINVAELSGVEHGDNLHIWFSSDSRKAAADALIGAYQQLDPDNAADFERGFNAWKAQENELNANIADAKATLNGTSYAATESVAEYLARDLGLDDATPTGYKQAAANESEPTPKDVTQFTEALNNGGISILVYNEQAHSELTHTITDSAEAAGVRTVAFTEQMPQEYNNLAEWMSALVEEFVSGAKA